jgi:hypothetical protein
LIIAGNATRRVVHSRRSSHRHRARSALPSPNPRPPLAVDALFTHGRLGI